MALTDLTRISTSGIATGSTIDSPILRKDVDFRGSQVGVTSSLFDSSDDALEFNDNVKLKLGNSGDLELYHNGSDNYIDATTGSLYFRNTLPTNTIFQTGNFLIKNQSNNQNVANFAPGANGGGKLYHENVLRFNTTSSGAVVTGVLTATSFSGPIIGSPINNPSGISTFYDLRVSNNLTVEGTTTTLDTNLIGVDRVEVGANSNTVTGIAVTQSGTADIVRLYDGASQVVTVDDTGKVGIGTAVPDGNLTIHGASGGNPGLLLRRDTGGGDIAAISWRSNTASFAMINYRDAAPHGLQFYSGGTASSNLSMIIRLNGNVGIGSEIPSQKLDVDGTVKATSFSGSGAGIDPNFGTQTLRAGLGYFSSNLNTQGNLSLTGGSTELIFNRASHTPVYRFRLTGGSYTTMNFRIKDDTNNEDRFIIRQGGQIEIPGDVGIGHPVNFSTTNISKFGSYSTLHIKGPSNEGAAIRLQDNGDTADSDDFVIYKNYAAAYLRVNGTDPLKFYMNGGDRLILDSSGNMGQGTTTPTTPDGSNADNPNNGRVFTIYGDSPAINLIHNTAGGGSAGSTDYAAINFGRNGSSSNPYRAVIGYKQVEDILHINANNHIVFDTGGNINTGEAMRITSSGRVGINTTSESMDGVTGNLNIANDNFNNHTVINLSRNTTADRSQIRFSNPNGNVGSIDTFNSDLMIRSANNITLDASVYIPDSIVHIGDTSCKIRFPSNDNISFETGGYERVHIDQNGCIYSSNFGIGTNDRWKIRPNNSNADLTFEYSTSSTLSDSNIKVEFKSSTLQMQLASDMKLNIGGSAGHCPLHVTTENTTYGKNAIFGSGGWVNSANYHYTDANISLLGQDADGNQKGAGVEFTARNTGGTNWLHGALTFGRDGGLRLFNGGAGNTVGSERFRIASDGVIHVNSPTSSEGGRIWGNSSALYLQSGNGRQTLKVSDASAGVNRTIEMTSAGNLAFPSGNGIDFAAAADIATGETVSTSILRDYEEGTFTPTLYYGSGTSEPSYSWRWGHYIKVGRQVTIWFMMGLSNFTTTYSQIWIGGLPFQAADPNGQWKYLNHMMGYSHPSGWGDGSNDKQIFLAIYDNASKLMLNHNGNHLSYNGSDDRDVGTGQRYSCCVTYQTD